MMSTIPETLALAYQLQQAGNLVQAEELFRNIVRAAGPQQEAIFGLANTLVGLGRYAEAAAHYRHLTFLHPQLALLHNNLAVALAEQGRYEEAVPSYREATRLQPDYYEAHYNLGNAWKGLRRYPEAVAAYEEAIRLRPDFAAAHLNLGIALAAHGEPEAALARYGEALRLRPDHPEALNNKGLALTQRCQFDGALACYDRALQLRPDFVAARSNRGQLRLLRGDWAGAWPDYEWRLRLPDYAGRAFAQPPWDGSPLPGKTILLVTEQGMGDTFQFLRYAPVLNQQGARVLVECPESLVPLLTRCPGIDRLIPRGNPLPPHDCYAPLLSLPGLLQTTVESIPANVPYLEADPDRVATWRRELAGDEGFKVGIAWQGNPKFPEDRYRSVPLHHFAPLAAIPGVRLYSLQKGFGTEQLAEAGGRFPVTDLGARLDPPGQAFADTAAVLRCLDLVISTDTAYVHLAGALGVPVWVALARVPEWRWLLGRPDSPWYPTAHLFRQESPGDWEGVFRRLAEALAARAAAPGPGCRLSAEVSPGELLDKITILEIKKGRITDVHKLRNVQVEWEALTAARDRALPASARVAELAAELKAVNERLWEVEDALRDCEREQDFGPRFVELARAVYHTNDRRAAVKRAVNELLSSRLMEEKSYAAYGGE